MYKLVSNVNQTWTFCIIGQWFGSNSSVNRLYKRKETWQYKFVSIRAIYKKGEGLTSSWRAWLKNILSLSSLICTCRPSRYFIILLCIFMWFGKLKLKIKNYDNLVYLSSCSFVVISFINNAHFGARVSINTQIFLKWTLFSSQISFKVLRERYVKSHVWITY